VSACEIREAAAADAAAVAQFAERTFRETYAEFNTPADMEAHVAAHLQASNMQRAIADPGQRILVAEQGATLCAFAQLVRGVAPDGVTGAAPVGLLRFYVDTPWKGQGLAQRLMAASMATAVALGGDVLWLGVWERNPRAIAFYRKCGFTQVGVADFQLGADIQHDYILQRRLSAGAAKTGR
jgi:ribosomal protein S18 acetylase RimI-like enzyme